MLYLPSHKDSSTTLRIAVKAHCVKSQLFSSICNARVYWTVHAALITVVTAKHSCEQLSAIVMLFVVPETQLRTVECNNYFTCCSNVQKAEWVDSNAAPWV